MKAFFDELPFYPPLFMTPKGDAAVHLAVSGDTVVIERLASLHRGAGRAALTIMVEAADRDGVTLALTAKPQPVQGDGKKLSPAKLQAFYEGFGFVATGHGEFAHMVRKPDIKKPPGEGG